MRTVKTATNTAYLEFCDEYRHVPQYWREHPQQDRCWVPWNWCRTIKRQTANNSLVVFSPDDTTLHAVRADYDHLGHQRTQLYGNFWRRESPAGAGPHWEDFLHGRTGPRYRPPMAGRIASLLPARLRTPLRGWLAKLRRSDPHVIADRMSHR